MNESTLQPKRPAAPFRLLLRIPVPWIFVLAFLFGVGLQLKFPVSPESEQVSVICKIGGGVLFLAGALLAGWGLYVFRKARTTTVPGQSSTQIVTSGPYHFTRNPMYLGLMLAYLGEAGLLLEIWPLLLLPLTFAYLSWIVVPVEEGRLRVDFGGEYEQYCSRVARWI